MKKFIGLFLAVLSLSGLANPIDDRCPQHTVYGAPVSIVPETNGQYLCRIGYATHYVFAAKGSEYVVERVTRESIKGTAPRKDEFREDPEVPVQYRATLKDYTGSGYDRGHMAPAADFYYSVQAMSESFLLSNVMPQVPGNNRGIWKYTEEYTRAWANAFGEVYVITGTIFGEPKKSFGNGVPVPSHLYKVVIVPSQNKAIAFLYPNEKLPVADIPKYIVTIADIEKYTGLQIMPKLPANLQGLKTYRANWAEWSGQ